MHSGYQNLENFLSVHDKFVISTHESPDGDGLGAEIAFNELLENLGKKAIIINSDRIPDIFKFIDVEGEINILNDNFALPDDIGDYAQVVLDTHDFDNIGAAYYYLKDRIKDLFIIDHHEGGADKFTSNFIKADASSTCEIVYHIIKRYGKPLSFKSAQALYAGILFDTGSFRYPKTTAETYTVVADLVKNGANPFNIYEYIYESNSLSSFELRSLILSTMEVFHDGRLIAMKLTPEMILKTGALFSEGEQAINLPLTVKGVVASILVKQDVGGGPVKVSMRTKGDYDVAEIAIANGGGGHKNAAGFKSKLSFKETYENAVKNLEPFFSQAPS